MFYVPERTFFNRESRSLKLINRIAQDIGYGSVFLRGQVEPKKKSERKRYKTISEDASLGKKPVVLFKKKKSSLILPLIEEKRFIIKGTHAGKQQKDSSLNKMSLKVKTERVRRKKKEKIPQELISHSNGFMIMPWEDKTLDFY